MVINYLDDVLERNCLDRDMYQQRREQCRNKALLKNEIGDAETEDTRRDMKEIVGKCCETKRIHNLLFPFSNLLYPCSNQLFPFSNLLYTFSNL
jgi:hypothetical protein